MEERRVPAEIICFCHINRKWFQISNVNFQCSPYFAFFQTLQFKGFGPSPLFFFSFFGVDAVELVFTNLI
jgi:hypothetical protein